MYLREFSEFKKFFSNFKTTDIKVWTKTNPKYIYLQVQALGEFLSSRNRHSPLCLYETRHHCHSRSLRRRLHRIEASRDRGLEKCPSPRRRGNLKNRSPCSSWISWYTYVPFVISNMSLGNRYMFEGLWNTKEHRHD